VEIAAKPLRAILNPLHHGFAIVFAVCVKMGTSFSRTCCLFRHTQFLLIKLRKKNKKKNAKNTLNFEKISFFLLLLIKTEVAYFILFLS